MADKTKKSAPTDNTEIDEEGFVGEAPPNESAPGVGTGKTAAPKGGIQKRASEASEASFTEEFFNIKGMTGLVIKGANYKWIPNKSGKFDKVYSDRGAIVQLDKGKLNMKLDVQDILDICAIADAARGMPLVSKEDDPELYKAQKLFLGWIQSPEEKRKMEAMLQKLQARLGNSSE